MLGLLPHLRLWQRGPGSSRATRARSVLVLLGLLPRSWTICLNAWLLAQKQTLPQLLTLMNEGLPEHWVTAADLPPLAEKFPAGDPRAAAYKTVVDKIRAKTGISGNPFRRFTGQQMRVLQGDAGDGWVQVRADLPLPIKAPGHDGAVDATGEPAGGSGRRSGR